MTALSRGQDNSNRALAVRRGETHNDYDEQDDRMSKRKASGSVSKSERRRTLDGYDDRQPADDYDGRRRIADRSDSDAQRRRDYKRIEPAPYENSRALNDHDAALPQNQFFSEPNTYTAPYRPPTLGHAADYYGDQGESVHYQPGVRPQPPAYVVNAEQLHLQTPTAEAKPPPEPSAVGQLGAATGYFAMNSNSEAEGHGSSRPSKPGRPSQKPSRPTASPRSSPRPGYNRPSQSGGGANPLAAAAVGVGAGAAMDYFGDQTGPYANHHHTSTYQSEYHSGAQTQEPTTMYGSATRPPRPSKQNSGSYPYASAAAVGLGAAAAGAYINHQHNEHQHQSSQGYPGQYSAGPAPNFQQVQNQPAFPDTQKKQKRKKPGPLGKIASWWNAPDEIAQFEEYTEIIGVCKDCFDPDSPPGRGPRKHHYHRKLRREPIKHGSNLRVDKTYRHSSSDEDRRGKSSLTRKVAAAGLAGLGAAKVGQALYNSKHDFDDTYSVKSGKPIVQQRTSYSRHGEVRSHSRHASQEDLRLQRKGSRTKLDRRSPDLEPRNHRRRRSSSSSAEGLSRGNVMSVGASAAGLAVAAELAHRRRSRSRSRSRERPSARRKYFSKRVSPNHSYVDLTTTKQGTAGIASFFSSPSANQKKGKKPKGLFTLANVSSSSSDADLAFGEGTIRRPNSKEEKRRKEQYGGNDTAAIMNLASAGAALAEQSDRKGKDRRYADRRADETPSRASKKHKLHDHQATTDENDDGWIDESDAESTPSVDLALAYGGRLSATQSKESLASQSSGTGKWDWRWNKNKKQREEKKLKRRPSIEPAHQRPQIYQQALSTSQQPDTPSARKASSQVNPFEAAGTGAALGALGAAALNTPNGPSPMSRNSLQYIEPIPLSESVTPMGATRPAAMPGSFSPQPEHFATASQVELQQPQPESSIMTQTARIESLASTSQFRNGPEDLQLIRREARPREDFESRKITAATTHIRPSSPSLPPFNASNLSRQSVSFALTPDQLETERRMMEKEERRHQKRGKEERRKTADVADLQRKADAEKQREAEDLAASGRHESKRKDTARRGSVGASARSAADIDAEIARLRIEQKQRKEELRRQQDEKDLREREQRRLADERRRQDEEARAAREDEESREESRHRSEILGSAITAIAAGAGVVAASALGEQARKDSSTEDESKRRRKSSMKQVVDRPASPPREVPLERREPPARGSQQERIARMAAQRVRKTPSPVHEEYSKFFVPEEIASHVKEHNYTAQHRDDTAANVVDIEPLAVELSTPDSKPLKRNSPFSPDKYRPFGIEPDDDPLKFPWKVPLLSLVEPTPPGSRAISEKDPLSPMVPAHRRSSETKEEKAEDIGEPRTRKRSSSKVTWGDHDTYVYEVRTPEYENHDPVYKLKGRDESDDDDDLQHNRGRGKTVSPDVEDFYTGRSAVAEEDTATASESFHRPKAERVYTLDDDEQETIFMHERPSESRGQENKPTPSESFAEVREPVQEDHPPDEFASAEPTPLEEMDINELLGGRTIYQSPFAQTVSDVEVGSPQERPRLSRIETLPDTPGVEVLPTVRTPQPEVDSTLHRLQSDEGSRPSRSEQRRMERALSSGSADTTSRDVTRELAAKAADIPPPPPLPDFSTGSAGRTPSTSAIPPASPLPSDVPFPTSRPTSERAAPMVPKQDLRNSYTSIADAAAAAAKERTRKRMSMPAASEPSKATNGEVSAFKTVTPTQRDQSSSLTAEPKTNGDSVFDYLASSSGDDRSKRPKSEVGATSKAAMIAAASAAIAGIGARRYESSVAAQKDEESKERAVPISTARSDISTNPRASEPDFYATKKESESETLITAEPDFYTGRAQSEIAAPSAEPDFYGGDFDKPKKRKSKRGSEVFNDFEPARSMTSLPGTKEEETKSRRKSKTRGDQDDEDDTRSVASTSILRDDDRKSQRKSKRDSGIFDDDDNRSVVSTPGESS